MRTRSRIIGTISIMICSIALTLLAASTTSAQPLPRRPWDGALEVRLPNPTSCPPLATDMPLDVLIGYIGGDSLARTITYACADSMLKRMTCSTDTMRYALKYLYEMADYDPIRLYLWDGWTTTQPVHYRCSPGLIRGRLEELAYKACPDSFRTDVLIASSIIARVRVTATQTKIDTNTASLQHATAVTCTLLESIKGKRIPACSIDARSKRSGEPGVASIAMIRAEGSQPAVPGTCLQFEYRQEWNRVKRIEAGSGMEHYYLPVPTLADGFAGRPGPWVQPNTEYIVFLNFVGLRGDSLYSYIVPSPVRWFGSVDGLFPIVDGLVYDPTDDFGFGTKLTPEQFIAALRARIHTIINP